MGNSVLGSVSVCEKGRMAAKTWGTELCNGQQFLSGGDRLFIFGMDVLKVGEVLQTQEGTRCVDLWRKIKWVVAG